MVTGATRYTVDIKLPGLLVGRILRSTLPHGRIAVMLSRQADAPVRVALDRHEEQIDAGNRPATWQQLRIGALRDGTLAAISLTSRGTSGVAAEVFGLRAQDIHVRIGDAAFPAGSPSYGSRTTASMTPPARTAACRFAKRPPC